MPLDKEFLKLQPALVEKKTLFERELQGMLNAFFLLNDADPNEWTLDTGTMTIRKQTQPKE